MNIGYLNTSKKCECYGCEACAQVCPVRAISMQFDEEKFLYPVVNNEVCIHCSKCNKVCPFENKPKDFAEDKYAFGGHINDDNILEKSTSGGAFSAIAMGWCDENYVIFGATCDELKVYHSFIEDKNQLDKFRKSKYSQSNIGSSYIEVKNFLKQNKKVLFSGTPCQIAGLINFLGNVDKSNLLTIEVVCEGVPTPHYIERLNDYMVDKYKSKIISLDYRYKDMKKTSKKVVGKWDFQVMHIKLENGKILKKDRWFNPFWSIWLNHLMSRPSCYECAFAQKARVADISLGDLWGVHLYCPDLYAKNKGASLIVCNTEKGKDAFEQAKQFLLGHELKFEDALRYQSPMRIHISYNEKREDFMSDVKSLDYKKLCKKWANKPSIKLLWQKYVWGNRQKMWLWNLTHKENK